MWERVASGGATWRWRWRFCRYFFLYVTFLIFPLCFVSISLISIKYFPPPIHFIEACVV